MIRAYVVLLMAATVASSEAQQRLPERDELPSPIQGTAFIEGVVVSDDDPALPVRRAIVVLTGAGLRPSRGAITDDSGRFEFSQVPTGRFTITVSRASFITSSYGAKRPGRPGTPITVTDGARLTNLTVKIWRGAALGGTLRDETGVPVAGIEVTAIPARSAGSLLTLTNNGVLTDDLGRFRIFGLEPGTYVVAARPRFGGQAQHFAMSDTEVDAALDALRRRAVKQASAPVQLPWTDASLLQHRPFDYAPVYFPGTPAIGRAAELTLAAGQTHTGLDFSIQRVSTATLTGVVRRPDGAPGSGASLQLSAVVPPGPFGGHHRFEVNATAALDGSFRISQVTPGDYQLVARLPADPLVPSSRPVSIEPPSTPQLIGVMDLSVPEANIEGIVISVDTGIRIAGRFVFESDSQKPPADLSGLSALLVPETQLSLDPGRRSPLNSLRSPAPARARPDGTFEFGGVAPGRYQLRVAVSGIDLSSWQLKAATVENRDVLDSLMELTRGSNPAVEVAFDDRPTRLSGTLQALSGAPASDVFVVAFAADRELWGRYSRRIKAVRPSVDGAFMFEGLPTGDYLLAAITDADPEDLQTPAFLEQLILGAVRVRLIGGQPIVQRLRIGR